MTRPRLSTLTRGGRAATLAALTLAAAVLPPMTTADPAGAQAGPTLELVDQTWIVGDDPVVIVVALDEPVDKARLEIRVDIPVTSRDEVRAVHQGAAPGGRVARFGGPLPSFADADDERAASDEQPEDDEPEDEDAEGATHYRIEIPDEEVGEFLRGSPGALPVTVDLAVEGQVVDTLVTHVVVPDDADTDLEPVRLGATDSLATELAHRPDQTVVVPTTELDDELDRLEALPELPLALHLRPETLSALQATRDLDRLDRLGDAAAGKELLLQPWVPLDEEGWRRTGESQRVLDQYVRGRDALAALLDADVEPLVRLDDDATSATVGLLRSAGAGGALVEPDRATTDAASLDTAAADTTSFVSTAPDTTRPVEVVDDNGTPLPALVLDHDLADTLDDPDIELAAHRAATELAVLVAEQEGERAVVVDIEGIDPAALTLLTELIDDHDHLAFVAVSALFDSDPARTPDGAPVRIRLDPTPTPDLDNDAQLLRAGDQDLAAYAAMVGEDVLVAPLRTVLDAAADESLTTDDRRRYTDAVTDRIDRDTDDIVLVDTGRVTLATRTADLPLTLHNGQPVPVTVRLLLRAEKLVFPDGDTLTVELEPGENPVDVRVEARASGDARITATLTSPDDHLLLDDAAIPIRYTAL